MVIQKKEIEAKIASIRTAFQSYSIRIQNYVDEDFAVEEAVLHEVNGKLRTSARLIDYDGDPYSFEVFFTYNSLQVKSKVVGKRSNVAKASIWDSNRAIIATLGEVNIPEVLLEYRKLFEYRPEWLCQVTDNQLRGVKDVNVIWWEPSHRLVEDDVVVKNGGIEVKYRRSH